MKGHDAAGEGATLGRAQCLPCPSLPPFTPHGGMPHGPRHTLSPPLTPTLLDCWVQGDVHSDADPKQVCVHVLSHHILTKDCGQGRALRACTQTTPKRDPGASEKQRRSAAHQHNAEVVWVW